MISTDMPLTSPKKLSKLEIWQFHQDGFGPTQIARKMGCCRETVDFHLKSIRENLVKDPRYLDKLAEKEKFVADTSDQPLLPLPKTTRKKK